VYNCTYIPGLGNSQQPYLHLIRIDNCVTVCASVILIKWVEKKEENAKDASEVAHRLGWASVRLFPAAWVLWPKALVQSNPTTEI
jgi:hypothetical protein